ncbi:hypothetical protein, partial [Brevibacterium sp.]|uniref:hypothetical protein n=1 Tax=Brevibacterium sp. TaxID=1701 RepID=UPI00264957EB
MSRDAQEAIAEAEAPADTTTADDITASVEGRSQVRAHDGEPVSDDMASAAAVAAVVAIRQLALAYAANQASTLEQMATTKRDRAGFNAPRRNVRRRLPQTWTQ